jgi:hypothetical protein
VNSVEGLIGFKLQAVCNAPTRATHAEDDRELLRANVAELDTRDVGCYFTLCEQEKLLEERPGDPA